MIANRYVIKNVSTEAKTLRHNLLPAGFLTLQPNEEVTVLAGVWSNYGWRLSWLAKIGHYEANNLIMYDKPIEAVVEQVEEVKPVKRGKKNVDSE